MTDIIQSSPGLPATIEELSQFILVGREKLTAVRASIRAIDKLNLAKDVREQKREECFMLSSALLDAETRMGELMLEIPKATGDNKRRESAENRSGANFIGGGPAEATQGTFELRPPKETAARDLGFDKDQVSHFQTLARNKDLVEFVKAEARENDDVPTRGRVLELACQRDSAQHDSTYYDECKALSKTFFKGLCTVAQTSLKDNSIPKIVELVEGETSAESWLERIDTSIALLINLKAAMQKKRRTQDV